MTSFLLVAAYSYLLGSISFGYLLVRAFHGKDIRETGSGNIGATNVSRTSPLLGVTTLVLDALKGALAVAGTRALFPARTVLLAAAAFFAIVGHVFPIWLNFRGGKGVATGLGAFLVLLPTIVVVMIGIFVALLVAFRYVSLASILTVAFFPFIAWAFDSPSKAPGTLLFLAASSLLIVCRHHENIRRLLAHTEPRFEWRRK
ncbi:MAG TPA: glycerol-3-phosphate 1-O-acyltransferase PlsY [Terriglobales bacterium]|nr:glycerol-3-phosphate 1-O-acyltransferase PlsY [Terriglobales bacterium]